MFIQQILAGILSADNILVSYKEQRRKLCVVLFCNLITVNKAAYKKSLTAAHLWAVSRISLMIGLLLFLFLVVVSVQCSKVEMTLDKCRRL